MPLRVVLNVVHSLLMENRDAKERQQLEDELYGWNEMNERANRQLRGGGED